MRAGHGLPLAPDVVYAQDAFAALLLADLYPLTPQVFALHDDRAELWLPPQLPAVIARVVVFDERGRERAASRVPGAARSSASVGRWTPRLVRLGGPLSDRPRTAVLHTEHLLRLPARDRGARVRRCGDRVRRRRRSRDRPRGADPGSDGVRGAPRTCTARTAATAGVTPERYGLLEADGFSGRAEPAATDFERLRRDLDAYDPAMGAANRELALGHSARATPTS